MTRKRRRSGKTVRRSNAGGLTALALCFTRQLQLQLQLQASPFVAVAGEPPTSTAADAANNNNLLFSPVSVYAALALLAAGARGETLQELQNALGGDSRDSLAAFTRRAADRSGSSGGEGPAVAFACGAWHDARSSGGGGPAVAFACGAWNDAAWALLPAFRDAAAASYNAEARAVDFSNQPEKAVGEINASLAAATNNLIDSILDPSSVDALTTLVLCSAIHFKGRWAPAPFAKAHTVVDKFHRLDGSAADVPFMCSVRSQYIAIRKGYKVLKLSYRSRAPAPPPAPAPRKRKDNGGSATPSESKPAGAGDGDGDRAPEYSLCVFLPDERDGLPGLVDKLGSGPGFWHYRLPTSQVPVGDFRLPKFKVSASGSVREVLRDGMGIKSAFVAGEADLADMAAAAKRDRDGDDEDAAGTPPLYVADVCHKAVLEVDEGGAGAAASGTTARFMLCGASAVMHQPPAVDFVADHPFLFFVIEEVSRAIVFVGRVLDPSLSV